MSPPDVWVMAVWLIALPGLLLLASLLVSTYREPSRRAAILTLLADGRWRYGPEIARGADVSPGALYGVLFRMEEEGLIRTQKGAPHPGTGNARQRYRWTGRLP